MSAGPNYRDDVLALAAGAALAVFPAAMFPLPGVANACFAFVAAVGLALLARDILAPNAPARSFFIEHWPLMLAMCSLPLALAFHQVVSQHRFPDIPYVSLRFALFVPIAWALARIAPRRIPAMQWGFVVAAAVSAVWIHELAEGGRPPQVGNVNRIPFGNLTLLMGMMALISLGWRRTGRRLEIVLMVAACAAGLYTSFVSETRGGWVAIPVLLATALCAVRRPTSREIAYALGLGTSVIALVVGFSDRVRERVLETLVGLHQSVLLPDAPDTSISVRFELWEASLAMFRAHPLVGVGPDGFVPALGALAGEGLIGPAAARLTHSHNDVLYAMATLGTPGLIAILATYLVPGWYFARRLRAEDTQVRTAAAMGLALCAGFMLFGLTEAMFVITLTNAFYSLVAAACFAFVATREQGRK